MLPLLMVLICSFFSGLNVTILEFFSNDTKLAKAYYGSRARMFISDTSFGPTAVQHLIKQIKEF